MDPGPSREGNGESSDQVGPPNTDQNFFCHMCGVTVNHVQADYLCPQCGNGFLEKVEGEEVHINDENEEEDENVDQVQNLFGNIIQALLTNQNIPAGQVNANAEHVQNNPNPQNQPQPQQNAPQQFLQNFLQNMGLGNIQFQVQVGGPAQGIFLQPGGGIENILHGNLGDYAWGPGGVDNIVTQLLNQIEGGVPPMTPEKIKSIPKVKVTQAQVDNKVQCTTCMDELNLDEEVKELPCRHCFHEDCIVPWLQRHDTCPICRKTADLTKWKADRSEVLPEYSRQSSNSTQPPTPFPPNNTNTNQERSAMDTIDELD